MNNKKPTEAALLRKLDLYLEALAAFNAACAVDGSSPAAWAASALRNRRHNAFSKAESAFFPPCFGQYAEYDALRSKFYAAHGYEMAAPANQYTWRKVAA